jgi:hypothetical protein
VNGDVRFIHCPDTSSLARQPKQAQIPRRECHAIHSEGSAMTVISINFPRFKASHPTAGEFKKRVPDWPLAKWHPCCAKLSCAFNGAGAPIENYAYPDPVTTHARAFKSKNGSNYLMAVHDVRSYLVGKYGDPERFNSKGAFEKGTEGRTGIICFGLFHTDVWHHGDINHPEEFRLDVLWDKTNWNGERLMFWEVSDAEANQKQLEEEMNLQHEAWRRADMQTTW